MSYTLPLGSLAQPFRDEIGILMAKALFSVPDQELFWDCWHETHTTAGKGTHSSDALRIFMRHLQPGVRLPLLEVGCGQGKAAISLARAGHRVTAFDRSHVAIAAARRNAELGHVDVDLTEHDITQAFPYASNRFSGVFSHLSIHYFDDATTRAIFSEIGRVLKPGGILFFTARSVLDPFYAQGDYLSRDLYCLEGHVRRFFDEASVRDELTDWDVRFTEIYKVVGDRKANPGSYLRVLATRL
jgi:SAM-dependent methyltransferase